MATEGKKKKPAAKKPQDRKPKAEKINRPEDTPGFNLLKPFDQVPVWDQGPLLSLVHEIQGDAKDGEELELDENEVIRLIGPLGKALLPMAKDPDEFTKFASGKQAASNIMNLAFAWMAAMGEGESSENS